MHDCVPGISNAQNGAHRPPLEFWGKFNLLIAALALEHLFRNIRPAPLWAAESTADDVLHFSALGEEADAADAISRIHRYVPSDPPRAIVEEMKEEGGSNRKNANWSIALERVHVAP